MLSRHRRLALGAQNRSNTKNNNNNQNSDSGNTTSAPDPSPQYHPQSLHDVYETAFLLRTALIPDLVPRILDYAGYWIRTSAERAEIKRYNETASGQTYLSSPVIVADGPHPVREVAFSITSHDQGYSWDRSWHGTYEQSWTWFEALVKRQDSEDILPPRRLVTNVHASSDYKTHTVILGAEDEWVKSLKSGDSIEITAHARFPAWENHVSRAAIEIFTAAVR